MKIKKRTLLLCLMGTTVRGMDKNRLASAPIATILAPQMLTAFVQDNRSATDDGNNNENNESLEKVDAYIQAAQDILQETNYRRELAFIDPSTSNLKPQDPRKIDSALKHYVEALEICFFTPAIPLRKIDLITKDLVMGIQQLQKHVNFTAEFQNSLQKKIHSTIFEQWQKYYCHGIYAFYNGLYSSSFYPITEIPKRRQELCTDACAQYEECVHNFCTTAKHMADVKETSSFPSLFFHRMAAYLILIYEEVYNTKSFEPSLLAFFKKLADQYPYVNALLQYDPATFQAVAHLKETISKVVPRFAEDSKNNNLSRMPSY